MTLRTESRFADPDAAYRLLVEAHRTIDPAQSAALDAALVLLLANHIGDHAVFAEAIAIARSVVADVKPA
ncbi:MAG: DUF2783 domain-containing protein [Alphaproteobacteria bacterium]|nr:DUF2783 domain-containing protein [Alphaproteobacteria bacterium]